MQWDGHKIRKDKWTNDPKRLVPDGCIFITVKGAGVGKIFPGISCAIGRDVYAFKPKTELSAKFIEHAIRFTVQDILRHAVGDIPGLSKAHILQHEIGIPEPQEQERIVAEIEKQFSRLDEAVTTLKRVKANLKRYKASVLKAAVEGKLNRDGKRISEHTELVFSQWRKARLGDICNSITDGDHQPPPKQTVGIPFLTIGNISGGHLDFSDTRYVSKDYYCGIKADRIPKSGDILYTVVGATIGIPVLVDTQRPFCFQRHIAILKPASDVIPGFLWILMASPSMLRAAWKSTTGSAQPTLPLKNLRTLPVIVPPLAEQKEIVAEVERRLSVIDELEAVVEANLTRADRLRQAILSQAFAGKLVCVNANKEGRQSADIKMAKA